MATPSPVRLLIADLSENRAHEIDSVLRDAGISTRPEFFSDLAAAAESASVERLDLMLCNAGFDHLEDLLPGLRTREPDLPIIVHDDAPDNLTRGLALGATDVVFRDDDERLLYVIKRELHHVCRHQRLLQIDRALKEAERRCELLLANSTAAIAYVHEGMHIYANADYLTLFGFEDSDDLLGLPLLDLVDPAHADEFKARMKAFRTASSAVTVGAANGTSNGGAPEELSFPFRGRSLDDKTFEANMTLSSADYEGEHCTQVLVRSAGDSTASSRTMDATGTSVATAADETTHPAEPARDAISEFVRTVTPVIAKVDRATLLVVEIDDFHDLQVEHGLSESKAIVAEIARWFKEDLSDVVVERIADHRFGAIVFGSEAGGDVLAEQVRAQVEQELFDVNGRTIRCSVTIGAVTITPAGELRESVELAFKTMLSARETKGNNSVLWYEPGDPLHDENGLDVEQKRILGLVNEAIDGSRFLLLFQPTISLRGDAEEHYEVFLRLSGDGDEQLAPDQFLELAIEHGVAGKIDRWVILHSIKLLSAHRADGHNTRLTINLTSNSLIDDEFVQWLSVAIKAARLPSDAVVFQIAEPDAANHVRQAGEFVDGLKKLHCRSSLRHFAGTDESYRTLSQLAVDFVKLDGALVQVVQDDPGLREELTETIQRLQGLGKLTVIPMVESATMLSTLWQAGANYIQGHYLQEPTPEMNYDFTTDD